MITAEKFRERVGCEPVNDDLERCNCKDAGTAGHMMCGWCKERDRPVFECVHCVMNLSNLEEPDGGKG